MKKAKKVLKAIKALVKDCFRGPQPEKVPGGTHDAHQLQIPALESTAAAQVASSGAAPPAQVREQEVPVIPWPKHGRADWPHPRALEFQHVIQGTEYTATPPSQGLVSQQPQQPAATGFKRLFRTSPRTLEQVLNRLLLTRQGTPPGEDARASLWHAVALSLGVPHLWDKIFQEVYKYIFYAADKGLLGVLPGFKQHGPKGLLEELLKDVKRSRVCCRIHLKVLATLFKTRILVITDFGDRFNCELFGPMEGWPVCQSLQLLINECVPDIPPVLVLINKGGTNEGNTQFETLRVAEGQNVLFNQYIIKAAKKIWAAAHKPTSFAAAVANHVALVKECDAKAERRVTTVAVPVRLTQHARAYILYPHLGEPDTHYRALILQALSGQWQTEAELRKAVGQVKKVSGGKQRTKHKHEIKLQISAETIRRDGSNRHTRKISIEIMCSSTSLASVAQSQAVLIPQHKLDEIAKIVNKWAPGTTAADIQARCNGQPVANVQPAASGQPVASVQPGHQAADKCPQRPMPICLKGEPVPADDQAVTPRYGKPTGFVPYSSGCARAGLSLCGQPQGIKERAETGSRPNTGNKAMPVLKPVRNSTVLGPSAVLATVSAASAAGSADVPAAAATAGECLSSRNAMLPSATTNPTPTPTPGPGPAGKLANHNTNNTSNNRVRAVLISQVNEEAFARLVKARSLQEAHVALHVSIARMRTTEPAALTAGLPSKTGSAVSTSSKVLPAIKPVRDTSTSAVLTTVSAASAAGSADVPDAAATAGAHAADSMDAPCAQAALLTHSSQATSSKVAGAERVQLVGQEEGSKAQGLGVDPMRVNKSLLQRPETQAATAVAVVTAHTPAISTQGSEADRSEEQSDVNAAADQRQRAIKLAGKLARAPTFTKALATQKQPKSKAGDVPHWKVLSSSLSSSNMQGDEQGKFTIPAYVYPDSEPSTLAGTKAVAACDSEHGVARQHLVLEDTQAETAAGHSKHDAAQQLMLLGAASPCGSGTASATAAASPAASPGIDRVSTGPAFSPDRHIKMLHSRVSPGTLSPTAGAASQQTSGVVLAKVRRALSPQRLGKVLQRGLYSCSSKLSKAAQKLPGLIPPSIVPFGMMPPAIMQA